MTFPAGDRVAPARTAAVAPRPSRSSFGVSPSARGKICGQDAGVRESQRRATELPERGPGGHRLLKTTDEEASPRTVAKAAASRGGGEADEEAGRSVAWTPLPSAVQKIYTAGVPHTDRNGRPRMAFDKDKSFLPLILYDPQLECNSSHGRGGLGQTCLPTGYDASLYTVSNRHALVALGLRASRDPSEVAAGRLPTTRASFRVSGTDAFSTCRVPSR